MSPKLLVVIGATGSQGGSVINTFHNDPEWKIRGLTRNASSPASTNLKSRGVEMVEANLDDTQSLISAFTGAHAIFSVLDFWAPFFTVDESKLAPGQTKMEWAREYEFQQGKNVLDAAAQTEGLEKLVFSALSYASKWSGGKYTNAYHFDSEGRAVEYGHEKHPKLMEKTSRIQIGMYLTNMSQMPPFWPVKDENDVYVFKTKLPVDHKMPMISTNEDTGPLVKTLVNASPGKNLVALREWKTFTEWAEIWGRVLGKKTKYVQLGENEEWTAMPEEVRADIEEGYRYFVDFGFAGGDPSVICPKDLGVPFELGTVEDWIRAQDWSAVVDAAQV